MNNELKWINFLFAIYKLHLRVTEVSKSLYCSEGKFDQSNKDWSDAAAAASRCNSGGALSNLRNLLVTFLHFLYFCRCSSVNPNVPLTRQHTADVPRSLSLYFTLWSFYRSEIPNKRTVDVNGADNLLYRVTFALPVGRAAVGEIQVCFWFVTA